MAVTLSANDIQPRAQEALASSHFYELRELAVESREDVLVLSGSVSSFFHKQLAQEVVRSLCEDVELLNAIRVE
jgi:hypothetical protein